MKQNTNQSTCMFIVITANIYNNNINRSSTFYVPCVCVWFYFIHFDARNGRSIWWNIHRFGFNWTISSHFVVLFCLVNKNAIKILWHGNMQHLIRDAKQDIFLDLFPYIFELEMFPGFYVFRTFSNSFLCVICITFWLCCR